MQGFNFFTRKPQETNHKFLHFLKSTHTSSKHDSLKENRSSIFTEQDFILI